MWSLLVLALLAVDLKKPLDVRVAALVQLSGLTLSQTTVTGGPTVNGTVTLAQAAGANGVTVKFQSSKPAIAAVPASVVVQPGATSATFIVQTYPSTQNPNVVTDPPSADISAQVGTSTKTVKLIVAPPKLASLSFNPASVTGSTAATGQVTISGPAPSAGVTIALAVAKPDAPTRIDMTAIRLQLPPVTVPPQVVVPAGATSGSFTATTKGVSASTPVQINASYGPFNTKSATLTVLPPAVDSIGLSPTKDPVGGASVTGTITLTSAAGADGFTTPLTLSDTHTYITCGPKPDVPTSVTIAAGATSASFPVTTSPSTGRYRLSAGGKWIDMFVREALINSNSLQFPDSVKGGTTIQAKLQLNGVASTCGFGGHYKLQSSNTNFAQVPTEVVVPIDSSVGAFSITTSAVPNNQTVDISVLGNVGYGFVWLKKTLTLTP